MNCYFHPAVEGVVTCGKCGVAMCRECEQNAFFRLDNGNGQALCNRCSLVAAQENVDFGKSYLKSRLIKLIICAVLVFSGLIAMWIYNAQEDSAGGIFIAVILWAISGAVSKIGDRNNDSIKTQIKDAVDEYNHPISSLLGKIIVNAIFGPIMLLINIYGYMAYKALHKKDLEKLNYLQSILNE